jgi:hypothetical protein
VSIHWEGVPVEAAAIAEYGYPLAARLWVAKSSEACRLVERMAEKMREYASMLPYTAPIPAEHDSVTFYVSLDKRDGTLHVFWCESGYVIWLHVYEPSIAMEAVKEVVEFYKR